MRASIIIAAHNEGEWLLKTIESCVETAAGLDYEIVVADDASTDDAPAAAARRFAPVRLYRQTPRRGASPTKHLGAQQARGDVFIFLDAHSKPEHGSLQQFVRDIEETEGQAIITPRVAVLDVHRWQNVLTQVGHGYAFDLLTMETRWVPLEELQQSPLGRGNLFESPALIGCAFAISRAVYEKVWGFDSHMNSWGVEDLDLALKCWLMGHPVLHDPQIVVGHRFQEAFTYSVPAEHIVVNQLRMAYKNYTHAVWGDWLESRRQRHVEPLPEHPEGLWARAWELFKAGEDSARHERSYLHAHRQRDEFGYARRFGLEWPQLTTRGELERPLLIGRSPSPSPRPSPSPSPPPCRVTGITPSGGTFFLNTPVRFAAQGTNLGSTAWSAPGGSPPTGTGATFTTRWTTTGNKTVTAGCGGTSARANVAVVDLEIQINNTPTVSDDIVQLKCIHPAHRSTVSCRIRLIGGPATSAQTVVLTNPDGRLRFPNPANLTTNVTLPANGGWVPFTISGEAAGAAIGDARIVARLNGATGAVLSTKSVTVLAFDPSQILLTVGGNYALVGTTYTVPGGVAVNFSSQATLKPAGLNCAAPQITNLRIAIMQESSAFTITTTWDTPTVAWLPATPSGTSITVSTTMRETTTYDPTVIQPVNDGLAGASPLYSKSAGALMPPLGCAGGAAATSSDTPSQTAPATFAQPVMSAGVVVATVTWTRRVNTTRAEHFRTFSVVFNNATGDFCALREATWDLACDSSLAGQHATVTADVPASVTPATGVQANNAPTRTIDAGVGPATTMFAKP